MSPSRSRKLRWLGDQDAHVAKSRCIQPGQLRSYANANLKEPRRKCFDDKRSIQTRSKRAFSFWLMIIVSRRCSISQAACVVQGLGDNDNASFSTLSDISGTIRAKMRVHTHLKKQWLHHQRNLQNVATNKSIPSFADKVTVHDQMLILVLEFIFSCFFWASLSPTHGSLCPTTARHPFLTAAAELRYWMDALYITASRP